MANKIAPTRSNLMRLKEELEFALLGYELLDQKRSIIISELLNLVDQAVDFQNRVENSLKEARESLEKAIVNMGRLKVANLIGSVSIESSITLSSRRIMGVELPKVETNFEGNGPFFSPEGTSFLSEISLEEFSEALSLMGRLAELKVSIMRLAREAKRTIRKVNSLEKLVIPDKRESVKNIEERIEEQERENIILLKSVKERMLREGK